MPDGVGRDLSRSFSLLCPKGHTLQGTSKQGEGPTLTLPLRERGFEGDAKSSTAAPTGR